MAISTKISHTPEATGVKRSDLPVLVVNPKYPKLIVLLYNNGISSEVKGVALNSGHVSPMTWTMTLSDLDRPHDWRKYVGSVTLSNND